MRVILLISALLASALSHAVSKSDFAYGYTLEVDGDGAIYSLSLPEEVYHGLTRADRGDLRIFNSQDVAVPHHIKRLAQDIQVAQADVTLPVFPLYAEMLPAPSAEGQHIHIVTDDKGAIIDINYGKAGTDTPRKVNAYLLDASQLAQAPNALLIAWPSNQADFVMSVDVAGSDDLSTWQTLVAHVTLSNLQYGGHTLIQQRIDLPLHKLRYLRLSWHSDTALTVSAVQAQFPPAYQSQERKWSTFMVTDTDPAQQIYLFDTHCVLPADRVNIELPQPNTLVEVSLESADNAMGPWYTRYHGLLYDLHFAGNRLKTPDQGMGVTTDRYWRLQVLSPEGRLEGKPQLRLGWIPEQLYFIAQGEAPFTLAYGSARVTPVDMPLAQLLGVDKLRNQQQLIKAAQLGSRIELGNTDKLKPAQAPTDWKQIILWLVLIAGVGVLGLMAWRLYKQMDQAGPSE